MMEVLALSSLQYFTLDFLKHFTELSSSAHSRKHRVSGNIELKKVFRNIIHGKEDLLMGHQFRK
jgi:hypothetical protein